ncbi:unnamed protein product (macronuclear) [Paramecium tetraurelia]|uniref:EF-hand domain-containing protein n=1 Tax=Paramecium tetraurelia TaxID=5888 RepID=A0E992_PARTE|nr:uncharacterized protein GSPATT00024590001 [Paramecium tetraurelia]CAK91859.1 unnamed protein product [Paramecium tetraurelia]|eukprot:XP_001459256.1 hypothetical protein (macronuclear) [Paramecium tetraurelia strain d4-2]
MKQKLKFDETLYADVEYLDDKGNFDFKKFADAASESIKIKNKDKAQNNFVQIQQKWDQQRQAIKNQKMEIKSKPVSEVNKKQMEIIDELKKRKSKLQLNQRNQSQSCLNQKITFSVKGCLINGQTNSRLGLSPTLQI